MIILFYSLHLHFLHSFHIFSLWSLLSFMWLGLTVLFLCFIWLAVSGALCLLSSHQVGECSVQRCGCFYLRRCVTASLLVMWPGIPEVTPDAIRWIRVFILDPSSVGMSFPSVFPVGWTGIFALLDWEMVVGVFLLNYCEPGPGGPHVWTWWKSISGWGK